MTIRHDYKSVYSIDHRRAQLSVFRCLPGLWGAAPGTEGCLVPLRTVLRQSKFNLVEGTPWLEVEISSRHSG